MCDTYCQMDNTLVDLRWLNPNFGSHFSYTCVDVEKLLEYKMNSLKV